MLIPCQEIFDNTIYLEGKKSRVRLHEYPSIFQLFLPATEYIDIPLYTSISFELVSFSL